MTARHEAVLVTGANGFIGRAVGARLLSEGWRVRGAVRSRDRCLRLPSGVDGCVVGDIHEGTRWDEALHGIQTVIHLGAAVHGGRERDGRHDEAFRVNALGTARLARACLERGVRRLVFLSSASVLGPLGKGAPPAREDRRCRPVTAYARSKLAAEESLRGAAHDGLASVALRPPMVYGFEAPGNFDRLARWIEKGLPLPIGMVKNERSFLYIGNLVDAIARLLSSPMEGFRVFHIADRERLSSGEFARRLGSALGRRAHLVPVPPPFLRLVGRVTGRTEDLERLIGSSTLDDEAFRTTFAWNPPFTSDEAFGFIREARYARSPSKDEP
ncbi:MAG: NAD-dependent epimerase/dehydratase family protein [Euryarchaeota archaeon]|nr:NAD-dependent epimerase/dehydratase family protein [Euryarchaeota archaeon]